MFAKCRWVVHTPFGSYRVAASRWSRPNEPAVTSEELAQISFFARAEVERRDPTAVGAARSLLAEVAGPLGQWQGSGVAFPRRDDSSQVARDLESAIKDGRLTVEPVIHRARVRRQHHPIKVQTPPPLAHADKEEPEVTTTWIGLSLVDQHQQPVPSRRYEVVTANQEEHFGVLDSLGSKTLRHISHGVCRVTFPEFEDSAFQAAPDLFPGCRAQSLQGPARAPSGSRVHQVGHGEHLASIAVQYGFASPATLWNHPANAHVRACREDPCVLLPGDEISIPTKALKEHYLAVGQHHTIQVFLPELVLRLRLLDLEGEPYRSTPCVLQAGAGQWHLNTDADGVLQWSVPDGTTRATLTVGELAYELEVGALDPISELSGVRERLRNLGHWAHGAESPSEEVALDVGKEFFDASQLQPNRQGLATEADDPRFVKQLAIAHGC